MPNKSVRELPITFTDGMIAAERDGRKSQTRRLLNPQPSAGVRQSPFVKSGFEDGHGREIKLPWLPGDRLWVKETHWRYGHWEKVQGGVTLWVKETHCRYGHFEKVQGGVTPGGQQKWAFTPDRHEIRFGTAGLDQSLIRLAMDRSDPGTPKWHKRLTRFMPRTSSRRTLEVTKMRIQRLQQITEADAVAEGAFRGPAEWRNARDWYADLWDSIYGAGAWDTDPWVTATTFRPVVCETCDGGGWVLVHSNSPPAFGVCGTCRNPDEHPSP